MKKYQSMFKENKKRNLKEINDRIEYPNVKKVMDIFFEMTADEAEDMFEALWSFYAANPGNDEDPWMQNVGILLGKVVKEIKNREGN